MELKTLFPVLLSLLAYLGWGIGDTVSIKLFRSNSPSIITFNSGLGRILFWLFFLPLFYGNFAAITFLPLLFNLIAGLTSGLGYYFYGKAANYTNPSLVAAISGGWGGSALLFSLLLFDELISVNQWLSIFLIFLGLILVTFDFSWLKKISLAKDKGLFYAFLALFTWGICGAFLKTPAVAYGWYWTSLIMLFPYCLVLLLEKRETKPQGSLKINNFGLFLVYVLLIVTADLGYNASFQFGGDVAVVGTIAGSYATLSTYLCYKIYREPLLSRQKIGIVISLLGIILTSYFSSI